MRPSITLRLSLLFAATSAAVLLAVGLFIGQLVDRHFQELDLAELHGKMELVRHAVAGVRRPADLAALPRRLDEALVGHHGVSVSVFRPDGEAIYAPHGAELPPALLQSQDPAHPLAWARDGKRYRGIAGEATVGEPSLGPLKVAVVLDLEHHADFVATFRIALWTSVAAAILLTSLLGWLIARRGLAPVRSIAGVARGISAERLHDRLRVEDVPAELVDLANAFNEMLSRLEDSFRRLSDFSSDIAHELRTPISNLMMQTQVAVSKSRTADEYREILYSNLEEYERLTRMVSDMLFIAKAENGLIVPERREIDLAAEIASLIEFYQPLAEDKGVGLAQRGEGHAEGDRLMIRRALGNLLSNAIRHTPGGGAVAVLVEGGAGATTIAVENTGDPIPPEHLPRLFDRFYRADPSRHRSGEGAGLGLAIVKSIVEAHGGRIEATSDNGRTRFTVSLPA